MTEDEAKTKWCPFVQVSIDGVGARITNNRGDVTKNGDENKCRCIGSWCMAWRWEGNYDHAGDNTAAQYNETMKIGGYCGLSE